MEKVGHRAYPDHEMRAMPRQSSFLTQGFRLPRIQDRHAPTAGTAAFVVALGLASPNMVWAATADSQPVSLDVDVMVNGPDAAPLEEALLVDARSRLAELGHETQAEGSARIRVLVDWHDETKTAFVVTVTAERGGEIFLQDKGVCSPCGTQELFDQIGGALEGIAAEMASAKAEPEPEPEPVASAALPLDAEDVPRTKLGAVGWIGVAAAGTGLVAGGAGAWVWSKGKQVEPDSRNALDLRVTDYRPPGIALTVTGGVLFAGGVVLIVADVVGGRRRRARSTAMVVPGGLGVTVGGSF